MPTLRFTVALACLLGAFSACSSLPQERTTVVSGVDLSYVTRGTSTPTIVFQSGLGDGKAVWAAVIERLGASESIFAYDRPGYGSSALSTRPRDPCTVAEELRDALTSAAVKPPYLLVGHSLGGLYQYAFASLYPEDVIGLLLLDPTHPEHWARMQEQTPATAAALRFLKQTVFTVPMRREFDDQAGCVGRLRDLSTKPMPALLLARSRFQALELGDFQLMVRTLEKDWSRLMPGISRREVESSGHYIQKDRPDAVAQQLLLLTTEFRKSAH